MSSILAKRVHLVALALALLITIATAFSVYDEWKEYSARDKAARETSVTVDRLEDLLSFLKDAETGQRGYLLTGDLRYLEPYTTARPQIETLLGQLEPGESRSGDIALLRQLVSQKLSEVQQIVDLRRSGDVEAALEIVRTNQGKATMDEIRAVIHRMAQSQIDKVRSETRLAGSHATRMRWLLVLGSIIVTALLVISTARVELLLRSQETLIHKLAEARRHAERQKEVFETTLRSIGDAVIATDERGRIRFMNAVAENLTGWPRADATGHELIDVFPIENETTHEPVENPVSKVLREGIIVGLANHTLLKRRDGRQIPIDDSGAPILDREGQMTGVVLVFRDVGEQREAQRQLAESERRHRMMFEGNPQPMWVFESHSLRFLDVNDAAIAHYGYSREEFLSLTLRDIRPQEDIPALLEDTAVPSTIFHKDGPWRHRKKDGTIIDVEITAHPIEFAGRDARVVMANDITEKKRLQEQLQQSQKLEAIGSLAGGVAHDFNNLLTVISGYAEMIRQGDSADAQPIEQILKAAERAAGLTQQLLAFSRRQVLQPKMLNLNTSVLSITGMLQRLLGEDITVVTNLESKPWSVLADPGQIDQIIMNLAVNARDAMQTGGTLTLQTENVTLDDVYASSHLGVAAGEYVAMSISDTGEGMSEETKARIFEPFFTTKASGRGTGLGLSTVYGIVKQSGGNIWVYSEVGKGTRFTIYLPRFKGEVSSQEPSPQPPARADGHETILIVEDDSMVRTLVAQMLSHSGYRTLAAETTDEAMRICSDPSIGLDLIISDLVMPGMDGREVARFALQLRPKVRLLFMSGYTEHAVLRQNLFEPGAYFIQKPFSQATLAVKVREILDDTAPA